MKPRTLIASLLMAGLLGTIPGMALADGHGNYKTRKEEQRDYRGGDRVRHGNQDYIYRGGRFYRPERGRLITVRAPVGAIVASLPFGFSAMVANGNTYFQVDGSFFRPVNHGYMVCEAPVVAPSPRHYQQRLPGTVVVRPAMLNVRSGPGQSFGVSGQVVRGDQLQIRGNSDGWFYVKTPRGLSGWVMVQFTSPYVAG